MICIPLGFFVVAVIAICWRGLKRDIHGRL